MLSPMSLTQQFIRGLKEYNLSREDLQYWKYCGGNEGRHHNYFKISCPETPLPEPTDTCVCGHAIKENCYITNGTDILVLGNCCIQRFCPTSKRSCEKCGAVHKNRKNNRCNTCRIGICDTCNRVCDKRYPTCYYCKFNSSTG